ncbi:MAG: hypothetical protein Q8Q90_02210 [bacterium]|nr:hypothetical protein [bacterium]
MKRLIFIAFLVIFTVLPKESSAFVARGDSVYFDGYMSWDYKYQWENTVTSNHLAFERLWINAAKNISDSSRSYLYVSTSLLRGNIEVQEGSLNLIQPFKRIDKITAGRFVPPFAREWSEKSLDQLNLPGGYSVIYDQLVYADDGIQMDFHKKRLYVSLGSFLGERSGGHVREQKDGKLHSYAKVILTLPSSVDLGGSYRYSRTRNNLWAAWAKWGYSGKNISAELVGFGKDVQWFVNYGQKIAPHFLITVRYEDLKYQPNRYTSGVRFYTRHVDVKAAFFSSGELASSPLRWGQAEVLFRF